MAASEIVQQERRKSQRYACAAMEVIVTPYEKPPIPPESEFRTVQCLNISTGGLAFHWPRRPDFEQVVIGLGIPTNRIFMISRVVHCQDAPEVGGYLVGCEFVKRMLL